MTRTMKHTFVAIDSGEVSDNALPTAQAVVPAITDAHIGEAQTWGGIDNVVSVKHLFFFGKLHLHYSSGNRAGAWLAVHLAGIEIEPSIALARQAGLIKLNMETRVRNYQGGSVPEKS